MQPDDVDQLEEPAHLTRVENGLFIVEAWSRGVERLLGRRRDQVISQPMDHAAPPINMPGRRRREEVILRDGHLNSSAVVRHENGRPIVIHTVTITIPTPAGPRYLTVFGRRIRPQIATNSPPPIVTPGDGWDFPGGGDRHRFGPVPSMTEINSKVGPRLLAARETADLSKRKLAALAGVTTNQIRDWETGRHVPTPANVARLVPHIGGKLDDYFAP